MDSDFHRQLGTPQTDGLLILVDHASDRVPSDIDLGIDPRLLALHIAVDIGVCAITERMIKPGTSAWMGNISRLVCDLNRALGSPGMFPEISDGHVIPGNVMTQEQRSAREQRFFEPYHAQLASLLSRNPPALILSLHSFTPCLETNNAPRPWEVGVLYNEDDRVARLGIPYLEQQGLIVGDQQPYSGKALNASMNRHAEAAGIPYVSIEIRQDLICDEAGQEKWAAIMDGLCREIMDQLASAAMSAPVASQMV